MTAKGATWKHRPAGAVCAQCNYRPARISPKTGLAFLYCSDRCRKLAGRRGCEKRHLEEANAVRCLFGLKAGDAWEFTLAELRAIHRRALRLVPAGGMSRYPATRLRGGGR